ncbi:hypothetical protein V6N12_044405 [Hibiscus sabdariffa]|uniref:Sulfurtransferase n=1 Tax=Hibiscus sabdariffa TaxID=183260 RepID=A0ABR1ZTB0_9ROSI
MNANVLHGTLNQSQCFYIKMLLDIIGVLDEADRLLNEDFEKALDDILNAIPRDRHTYLFSATMTKKVNKLQRACLRNPVKIEAASKYSTVDTLKQQYRFVPAKHKDCYLVYILTEMAGCTSMVFTRTCDATRLLSFILRNLNIRAIPISGQMTQQKRLGALNKFKSGECNVLVCTDVASRGLDIPSVDMVINYDIPASSKDYIHRVGRTARAGRSGVAISLVNQYELEWYLQIEKLIGKKLPEYPAQEEVVLQMLESVTEAKRLSQMKLKEIGGTKRRKGGNEEEEEDIERYLGVKGKSSKKKRQFRVQAESYHTTYKTSGRPPLLMASAAIDARTNFSTQSLSTNDPVVSVDWLHANLREPDLKVLDASWYMPDEQRNPIQEYQVAHIPGALFFDVDGIADRTTKLPHMLPSEDAFAAAASALGIQNKDGLVVYDGKGIFSAARVWWMFRVFGHDRIWVLDGGLPRWRASGYDVESSASSDAILKASAASEAIEKVYQGQTAGPLTFQTKLQPHLVWTLDQVRRNIEEKTHQHIDARSKPRFDGAAPEPRKGIRSGHVPGSKCIPFPEMLDASQTLLPADELKNRFSEEGISLEHPVVTSCGTGVTACILALGLHRLGKTDVAVYDGSWTEWGAHSDTPVDTSS